MSVQRKEGRHVRTSKVWRVLVTGGAGYIGSHTAKALAAAGHEPIVFDNLSQGHAASVLWGPLVKADLADGVALRNTLEQYRIDAVLHLAASAYVGESMVDPRKYFHNNAVNTLNLLDAMLDTGVRRFVFSSSCAVYGRPVEIPIREDHPQAPVNPYGESKLISERLIRWYGEAYGLQWTSLRYFNAAGAEPGGELGEAHDPETHVVPLVIDAALGVSPCFHVFGCDYPTPDGSAVRDYTHVSDLAAAHVRAVDYLMDGGESIALNLGSGSGVSVLEVISAVERVSGCRVSVQHAARRRGDPERLVADNRLSKEVLGCSYPHSNLDTIVRTAWDWRQQARKMAHAAAK